jgi:hypothetical protein
MQVLLLAEMLFLLRLRFCSLDLIGQLQLIARHPRRHSFFVISYACTYLGMPAAAHY